MSVSRAVRGLAVAVVTALMLALVAAPSQARPKVEKEQVPYGFFYDNIVTADGDPKNDLILIAGTPIERRCAAGGEPEFATLKIRTKGTPPEDGAKIVERFVDRAPLQLFDGGGVPANVFQDQYCEALDAGEATPEPLATGRGVVWARTVVDFFGPDAPESVRQRNGAFGVLRTERGTRVLVRALADLTFVPEFSINEVRVDVRGRL